MVSDRLPLIACKIHLIFVVPKANIFLTYNPRPVFQWLVPVAQLQRTLRQHLKVPATQAEARLTPLKFHLWTKLPLPFKSESVLHFGGLLNKSKLLLLALLSQTYVAVPVRFLPNMLKLVKIYVHDIKAGLSTWVTWVCLLLHLLVAAVHTWCPP